MEKKQSIGENTNHDFGGNKFKINISYFNVHIYKYRVKRLKLGTIVFIFQKS